jgi:lysophospholipase L1-like esterase
MEISEMQEATQAATMFEQERLDAIHRFYETLERWHELQNFRSLKSDVKHVKNIFFGDSITEAWPLHEFFPNHSLLNRGIGGDSIHGLYKRLPDDVLPYTPKKVFMLIGINGIQEETSGIMERITAVAGMIAENGIQVYLGSILPLRYPDKWDRFQYQDKIVDLNAALCAWAQANAAGFMDYHTLLKDETGQLAAEFARPDGTHLTFAAYRRMSGYARQFLSD